MIQLVCNCPRNISVDPVVDTPFEVRCDKCRYYWVIRLNQILEQGVRS